MRGDYLHRGPGSLRARQRQRVEGVRAHTVRIAGDAHVQGTGILRTARIAAGRQQRGQQGDRRNPEPCSTSDLSWP